jgi:hypothetical protein
MISLAVVPNVQAQSGITSILNLQHPQQVELQGGTAQATVTFTVYYNYYYNPQGYLVFDINDPSTSNLLQGSATATPVPCQSLTGTQNANSALCEIVPASSYGTESASFTLTFNSAQQYALRAAAGVVDQSGNVVTGSTSSAQFTISVTGQTVSTTTTITNLLYPSHAVLQNGVAQATVTLTVGYTGLPSGGFLSTEIVDPTTKPVTGSGTSTPDPCQSLTGTSYASAAICIAIPASSSGTESIKFTLTFNSAQQYALAVAALIQDSSGNNVISGSLSGFKFTISVTDKAQLNITLPNSVTAAVDGANQTAGNVTTSLQPGKHTISVPETVPLTIGSQLRFDHWSDGSKLTSRTDDLENDTSLTATYVTQYSLSLTDPSAGGAGWYDQGATAQFSVPSSGSAGILGILGAIRTFQGWYENGTLITSSSSGSITMNAPHTLSVRWVEDDTVPMVIMIVIVIAVAAIGYVTLRRKRTAVRAQPTVSPTPKAKAKKGVEFCGKCGAQLASDNEFCTECGARQP